MTPIFLITEKSQYWMECSLPSGSFYSDAEQIHASFVFWDYEETSIAKSDLTVYYQKTNTNMSAFNAIVNLMMI